VRKGYVDPAAVDRLIETYEEQVGPHNGARVVARAWADPALPPGWRATPRRPSPSLGYTGRQGEHMVAVFNTPETHHMVVCTLCSCYPWPVLGLPPVWYKSAPYRSRVVIEPRSGAGRLRRHAARRHRSAGLGLDRRGALPGRAAAPGRHRWLDEQQLALLVTRDSMIGTGLALAPSQTVPA
jgi:nitrile hydratase